MCNGNLSEKGPICVFIHMVPRRVKKRFYLFYPVPGTTSFCGFAALGYNSALSPFWGFTFF